MAEKNNKTRWSKTTVTDVGTGLLTEFAAGRFLNITSAFGSVSDPADNLMEMTELPDGWAHPLTIESVTKTDKSVTVCIQVTSLGNPEPYKLEQIGIFAVAGGADGPGEPTGVDKLLMVIEDVEDENGSKGVTIPAESDQLYTFKLYAVLTITNKDRLEISVSSAGIATIGAIQDAINKHNNDMEVHPILQARLRAADMALNGKESIFQYGDPTHETDGEKGQHYINISTGAEFVCNGTNENGTIWKPVDVGKSIVPAHDGDEHAHPYILGLCSGLDARLSLVELMYNTKVSGNPFTVTFESLTGLVVTGVWNTALARVEF